jgi:hypothetical protein
MIQIQIQWALQPCVGDVVDDHTPQAGWWEREFCKAGRLFAPQEQNLLFKRVQKGRSQDL